MAAVLVLDLRRIRQRRLGQIQRQGAFGEIRQRIDLGHARCRGLQRGQRVVQCFDQLLVELPLAGERSVAGAKNLVLELFQFRRDEPFGAFECLAPDVLLRYGLRLRLADFDVVAVHAVVADLQVADAGALAFGHLQVVEEAVRVGAERAKLVELGVEAGRNHATVADKDRRRFDQRRFQQRPLVLVVATTIDECGQMRRVQRGDRGPDRRQVRERSPQLRQIPRPRGAQRDPGQDALEVADLLEPGLELGDQPGLAQRGYRLLAAAHGLPVTDRPVEPALQQTATHRRRATVHQARQRVLVALAQTRVDLQVAPGGCVHDHGLIPSLVAQATKMRHGGALGVLDVLQKTTGRGDRRRNVLGIEAG